MYFTLVLLRRTDFTPPAYHDANVSLHLLLAIDHAVPHLSCIQGLAVHIHKLECMLRMLHLPLLAVPLLAPHSYCALLCLSCPQVRDHALSEHKTLKNLASDLDSMKVDHPGFHDKIEMLMTVSSMCMQCSSACKCSFCTLCMQCSVFSNGMRADCLDMVHAAVNVEGSLHVSAVMCSGFSDGWKVMSDDQ